MKPVDFDKNEWHPREDLDEVIDFIKEASFDTPYDENGNEVPGKLYWSWARNPDCKYITLRFDMRDGAFVILNRVFEKPERITLDQIKYQYRSSK